MMDVYVITIISSGSAVVSRAYNSLARSNDRGNKTDKYLLLKHINKMNHCTIPGI